MAERVDRRTFLTRTSLTVAGLSAAGLVTPRAHADADGDRGAGFAISLAQWSLHKELFAGTLENLDFAAYAKQQFGIDAVEYVNRFFMDKAKDEPYLKKMKQRADDHGVKSLLIMCDGEGMIGAPDTKQRRRAVANHHKWVDAAKQLGCHSIRVNAHSEGSRAEQQKLVADGLRRLCEYAEGRDINVLVENHGGLSADGDWLSGVMKAVDHPRIGTLPDFGNFGNYDPYKGVQQLMPWAKGVSAKSYAFNDAGEETAIDYRRMLRLVLEAGYHGHVGIEYEGSGRPAPEGIRLTKRLLERVRAELTA